MVDIGFLISKGVNVYMGRTIPVAPQQLLRDAQNKQKLWKTDRSTVQNMVHITQKMVDIHLFHFVSFPFFFRKKIAPHFSPEILALLFLGGWYVFTTAGPRAVACFAVGAALNLVSAGVLSLFPKNREVETN